MGGFFLVMDSYGHVDNFQPVFVKISMIFPLKNVRWKLDDFRKARFLEKKLIWRESLVLAEFKNAFGFTLRRHWVKRNRGQVGCLAPAFDD